MEVAILKKSGGVLRAGEPVKYTWIHEHADSFPVALLCRVLDVSRAGYCQSRSAPPSARRQKREAVAREARRFHARSHGVYGYRKVAEDIRQETGLRCSWETVRRVMR